MAREALAWAGGVSRSAPTPAAPTVDMLERSA
jgi:hypothetical protein